MSVEVNIINRPIPDKTDF